MPFEEVVCKYVSLAMCLQGKKANLDELKFVFSFIRDALRLVSVLCIPKASAMPPYNKLEVAFDSSAERID